MPTSPLADGSLTSQTAMSHEQFLAAAAAVPTAVSPAPAAHAPAAPPARNPSNVSWQHGAGLRCSCDVVVMPVEVEAGRDPVPLHVLVGHAVALLHPANPLLPRSPRLLLLPPPAPPPPSPPETSTTPPGTPGPARPRGHPPEAAAAWPGGAGVPKESPVCVTELQSLVFSPVGARARPGRGFAAPAGGAGFEDTSAAAQGASTAGSLERELEAEAFPHLPPSLRGPAERARDAFREEDQAGKGCVDFASFQRAMKALGIDLTHHFRKKLFYGDSGRGHMSEERFIEVYLAHVQMAGSNQGLYSGE